MKCGYALLAVRAANQGWSKQIACTLCLCSGRISSTGHENSEEVRELAMIAEALDAFERKRWPDGEVPDGKG